MCHWHPRPAIPRLASPHHAHTLPGLASPYRNHNPVCHWHPCLAVPYPTLPSRTPPRLAPPGLAEPDRTKLLQASRIIFGFGRDFTGARSIAKSFLAVFSASLIALATRSW